MVFLDTHVVVWLYATPARIPTAVAATLDRAELFVSPMVRLELAFLYEIGRLRDPESAVLGALGRDLGLRLEEEGWARAAEVAPHLSWTRDPFDRLIAAHAICYGAALCTRDQLIRDHYAQAFWG